MTIERIRETRQISALASSVRLAIVDALEGIGPCSVSDLARTLGVAPDGLYYHLRILEKRGLIRRSGTIVDAAHPAIELQYDVESAANRRAVIRVAGAITRAALRAFSSAFRPRVRTSGKRRELWIAQRTARLSSAQLERVNQLLGDLVDTLEEARTNRDDEKLYLVTFALSPYGKR